jgi:4-amino-4-deoxy-L-arabinose transferase
MYATMVIPFVAANFITPDTALTLWTTLAVLCFWKSTMPDATRVRMWQLLMCVAVGLGFLTKGPAALIPCGGMFAYLLVRRRVVQFFITPWALVGIVIFCLIGLGWYVHVSLKVPGAASYFFDNEVWGRLVSPKYRRNPGLGGALIYLPVILLGTLPWSGVWWEKRDYLRRTLLCRELWFGLPSYPRVLFLVCWFFVPMIILSVASSKLGLYALPVFPALAIISAQLYREKIAAGLANLRLGVFTLWKPATLMAVWVVALMLAKVGIARYPTRNDSRLLWNQLSGYLPRGDCEIVTIDEQVYGLLFYGAMETENTTMDERPYPMFTPPHPFSEELRDIPTEGHHFAIVVEKESDALRVEELLNGSQINYAKQLLPFTRSLFTIEESNLDYE